MTEFGDAQWCILRTSARHTMRLAATLAEDGFEVWTPVETRTIRVPKSNVRREVQQPIMPSYVFAKASRSQVIELLQLSALTVKPRRGEGWGKPAHADFSVMKRDSGIITIADRHFNALRTIEARRRTRPKSEVVFDVGADVRVTKEGGSFEGMVGAVKRSNASVTVLVLGRYPVTIPTCALVISDLPDRRSGASK